MAETSIDAIAIKVSSDASSAASSLSKLSSQLKSISSATRGSAASLSKVAEGVRAIASASRGANASGLDSIANAVRSLKDASKGALSKSVASNISELANASSKMTKSSAENLKATANALSGFSSLKGVNLSGTVNGLKELPEIVGKMSLSSSQLKSFNTTMGSIAGSISRVASQMSTLNTSYSGLSKNLRAAINSAIKMDAKNKQLTSSSEKSSKAADKQGLSFTKLAKRFNTVVSFARNVRNAIAGVVSVFGVFANAASTYIEDQNLSATVLGESYESSYSYWNKAQELMGVNAAEAIKYQGVFQELITGMGIAEGEATEMSKQLTQLGYDLSSFENLGLDESMLKIQSGISGELEPLRRVGYDLSNARMQQDAYKVGLEGTVSTMTQAEKVYLRYYEIMTQVTESHGDLARSLTSPSNQMRLFNAQVQILTRQIGFGLIPVLNRVLPYLTAFVQILIDAANAWLGLEGIDPNDWMADLSTVDRSSLQGVSDDADNISDSISGAKDEAEAFQKQLMGFDQINNITESKSSSSSSSSSSGSSSGSGSGGADVGSIGYDFFEGLSNSSVAKAKEDLLEWLDKVKQKVKDLLPLILAVGAGFLGWKIGNALSSADSLKNKLKKILGLTMGFAGSAIYAYNWLDMWDNGIDWDNLKGALLGLALAATGFGIAFGPVAAVITVIIGLVGLCVAGIKDMWENGQTWENVITTNGAADALKGIGRAVKAITTGLKDTTKAAKAFKGALKSIPGFGSLITSIDKVIKRFKESKTAAKVFETIKGWVSKASEAFKDLPGPVKTALKAFGKIASIVGWVTSILDIATSIKEVVEAVQSGAPIANETIGGLVAGIMGIGVGLAAIIGWPAALVAAIIAAVAAIAAVIYNNWDTIKGWFKPLTDWLSGIGELIQAIASGDFKKAGDLAYQLFLKPIVDKIKWVMRKINALGEIVKSVASGDFKRAFKIIYIEFMKPVVDKIKWIKNKIKAVFGVDLGEIIKGGLNTVIGWINSFLKFVFSGVQALGNAFGDVEIFGNKPFEAFKNAQAPQIQMLAEGGTVRTGQMFIAREAGPEMVGTMNGSTTVANNDQIVSGISAGVASAMSQMVPYLARIAGASEETAGKDFSVKLDGAQLARSINKASKRAGRALVTA